MDTDPVSIFFRFILLGVMCLFVLLGIAFIVICFLDCLSERKRKKLEDGITRGVVKIIANRD